MKYKLWKNETTGACYIATPGSDKHRPELICTFYGRFIALEEAEAEVILAMINQHIDENIRLKTEVERLRKAGDAMAKAIRWLPQSISDHHLDAWNAAKEGKQS